MKFSHNILHTYNIILSIIKHNWKIRRFWVVDPLKLNGYVRQQRTSDVALMVAAEELTTVCCVPPFIAEGSILDTSPLENSLRFDELVNSMETHRLD